MTTQQGFPAKSDTVTRDEPMALASRGLGLHGMSTRSAALAAATAMASAWGLPHVWGSSGGSQGRVGVVRWREPLPEGGAEGAVVDSAADLQQEIGTPSGPAHLLRFVHSTVHQEVGRPLGDGSPDPQAGTVTLGVVDRPVGLTDQIAVQGQHRSPQLPRECSRRAAVGLAPEVMDDGADARDAGLGILG